MEAAQPRMQGYRCDGCGKHFGGESGFTMHRVGEFASRGKSKNTRRCLSDRELRQRGYAPNEKGLWTKEYKPSKQVA